MGEQKTGLQWPQRDSKDKNSNKTQTREMTEQKNTDSDTYSMGDPAVSFPCFANKEQIYTVVLK